MTWRAQLSMIPYPAHKNQTDCIIRKERKSHGRTTKKEDKFAQGTESVKKTKITYD
jgi:hypothetical protein